MKSGKSSEKLDGVPMQEIREGVARIDKEPYGEKLTIRDGFKACPYPVGEEFDEDDVTHAIYVIKALGRQKLCFEIDQIDAIATCLRDRDGHTIPQDAATIITLARLKCDNCMHEGNCDYLQTDEVFTD